MKPVLNARLFEGAVSQFMAGGKNYQLSIFNYFRSGKKLFTRQIMDN